MESITENLKQILSRQFGVETTVINDSTHLVDDLGADSLDLMEVVMLIETKFKIKIYEDEYENALVFDKIVSLIEEKQKAE